LVAQIEGHQIEGVGEKFGRPTKIVAHLESLLEINFFHPPSKYRDENPFNSSAGVENPMYVPEGEKSKHLSL